MYESQFEEDLYNLRREKLRQIGELGQKAGLTYAAATYPNQYVEAAPGWDETKGAIVPWLRKTYDAKTGEELEAGRVVVSIAGRVMAIRVQGKAGFAQLQQNGARIQIYVRKDDVGEDAFALYKLLDLGDHIGVKGYMMRTRTGELTVHVSSLTFLAKAMLALPDKYHGLEDTELRYRQRYVDLFMNTGHTPKPTAPGAQPQEAGAPGLVLTDLGGAPPASPASPAPPQDTVILSEGASAPQSKDLRLPSEPPTESDPIDVREIFVKRAAVLRALRKFFDTRGYLEVETPMLHTVAGGATARPFKTHHNALDIPLSLRIAPELYLKRLVVGGLDRVYEINRNFRNEGVSTRHNPEFTMLEFYQAYANYHDLMDLTQELVTFVATEVNGTTLTTFNGVEIDLGNWQRLSMVDAIIKFWPRTFTPAPTRTDFENARRFFFFVEASEGPAYDLIEDVRMRNLHVALIHARAANQPGENIGKHIAAIFEAVAESHLIQPTIIYDFPLAVSPLSKIKPDEPDWVERFEFYIGGFEVGNAFSELNDPDDQRRRFEAQLDDRKRGDDEAMAEIDEDYLRALGYGLPPTAGEGIGIDRLTMVLTGAKSIRDVILFPLMRPLGKPSE